MLPMIDIKKQIQILLLQKGTSMTKLTKNLQNDGVLNVNVASLSRMMTTKTIKFETIQIILDYLGYELDIKAK